MHLSIITSTHNRHGQLATVLNQVKSQLGNLLIEHIVVSDGEDAMARRLVESHGAIYLETERTNDLGGTQKDAGLLAAKGQYVCFWDDDNYYEPFAAVTLLSCAWGADLGLCRVRHYEPGKAVVIPQNETTIQYQDIDTACGCIRKDLALRNNWKGKVRPGQDFKWYSELLRIKPDAVIRRSPIEVATHVLTL